MATIKVKVLECGRTSLDYELAVTAHPDSLLTQSHPERQKRWLHHPIYAYVIDHPDGPILVDTGVSPDFEKAWRHPFYTDAMAYKPGEDGLFTQRLKDAGYGPEDFRYVVITHLHTDHAGNAPLFRDAGAKIMVHEDELRGAITTKGALLREDDLSLWGVTSVQGFTRRDFGFLVPDRATTFYGDIEIARNVWVLSLPGHTWGTAGVAVRLERSGWLLIASDAIYLADTYGDPFVGSILNQNQETWARTALKVRRLAERYDMTVLPGHDDTVIERPAAKTGRRAALRSEYE
jgi:N-acyl homoserine lactone hydrolase